MEESYAAMVKRLLALSALLVTVSMDEELTTTPDAPTAHPTLAPAPAGGSHPHPAVSETCP